MSKYDTNKDSSISLKEFQSFITKDPDIIKYLASFGLITKEDLRLDFGGGDDVPECDSDLETEVKRKDIIISEQQDRLRNGIEHNYTHEDNQQQIQPKK